MNTFALHCSKAIRFIRCGKTYIQSIPGGDPTMAKKKRRQAKAASDEANLTNNIRQVDFEKTLEIYKKCY